MRDLNKENLALIAEIRKNEMRNPQLTNNSFPSIFDELTTNIAVCMLSDEELAVADVTIERIEVTEQLHMYMLKCRSAYSAMHNTHSVPKWLLEYGENDQHFSDFFGNLPTLEEDDAVMSVLEAMKAITAANAKALYTHYLELRADERTRQGAVQKIQLAYDVNGLLRRILMFNGYKGVEIDAVVGVSTI